MPTQIPLAQILAEDGLTPSQPAPAADLASAAESGGLTQEQQIEALLAKAFANPAPPQRSAINPDLLFKFCALGLGALTVAAGAFGLYLHRPVQAHAQSQLMRDMGNVMVAQQSQVEAAIATAQPPQYKCNALFGGCHFPEQQQTRTAADLNRYQASQDRFELPDSLGHAPAVEPPSEFEVHSAKTYLTDWNAQGIEVTAVAYYITQLRDRPDPTMPSPKAFEAAFTAVYGE